MSSIDPRDLELGVKQEDTGEPALSAATPQGKIGATPKKRKSTKKSEDTVDGEDKPSPTKKQKTPVAAKGIPDRYEDLSKEDKMMITWKEEGKSWKAIQEAWFTMTGNKHTGLTTRYIRVKAAIARVKDDDLEALEKSMAMAKERIEVEKKMVEKRLWAFVAEGMESEGAEKYDLPTLDKAWKRLQANNKAGTSKCGNTATVTGEE
ncbi:hypothetical protein E2P81_ATG01311 [Venturia nashicola]|uniref:Uncharacterized protein n=1 Tax=Venturia nashicola TaxID=86259 RepID=A0A4Z1PDI9_9PEZI|nr:hypothetical protein E6O75_ATG01343 [Venturia nashicola]TLD38768.1 hypothetical protein E2P81_ATG01311 [Venturia nashicola]